MTRQRRKVLQRMSIHWRLALISLGVIALLLSAFGFIISFTAENALFTNEATALHNEGHLAMTTLKQHTLEIGRTPTDPPGTPPPNFKVLATILTQRLTSTSTDATVLSLQGNVIISGSDIPFSPPTLIVNPILVQQTLHTSQDGSTYLIKRDAQNERQLVIFMPIVSNHHTIGILQINTLTAPIDQFITTLRWILILGVLGSLSLATLLMFPLISAALHPLVAMEQTSRAIAAGNLSLRLQTLETDDEIGHMTSSFNDMVAQLETAFRRQKQLTADISHELRTPLTALRGSLEILLIGIERGDSGATRRLVSNMHEETERMQRMIDDLLILTRLDEGKAIVHLTATNIRTVVGKVYDQAQQLTRGQTIHCQISPDIPLVCVDPDRLQQVLLNITDNALKYTPADGHIDYVVRSEEADSVIIEVHDTGIGIPPEAVPHVFDRFYRADPARTRHAQHVGGSGLGLAIAKELIEAQGGEILLHSTYSQGTTITIRLQAISAPEQPVEKVTQIIH